MTEPSNATPPPPAGTPAPPQDPKGATLGQAQKEVGIINYAELEKRVSAMEAGLAGMIGHAIAGARAEEPKVKSAAQHALDWFETVKAKYFPAKAAPTKS